MILQRYILRQLLVAFVFAVGGMLFIALPAIAVAAVQRLAGVETAAIVLFIPKLLLGLVPYILPLGYLLATVVTYGRLAADNEWTAIRMAGIQPLWMIAPAMVLGLACSVATVWLISTKLPEDKKHERQYQVEVLQRTITNLSPGRTELHLGRFYLQAAERDGNEFRRVFIHIPGTDERSSQSMQAGSLWIDAVENGEVLVIRMRDARVVHGSVDVRNANPTVRIDLRELIKPPKQASSHWRYMTSAEIRQALPNVEDPKRAMMMLFELHHRDAVATTYLMFCLLGAATGLLLRRGTQLAALGSAVGYAMVYYLSLQLVKPLVETSKLDPVFGAWSANIGALLLGIVLLRKALRE